MRRMRMLFALFGLVVLSGCRLYAWGGNGAGQLGDGSTDSTSTPALVVTDDDWSGLEAGTNFACGVRVTGTLWCWGANDHGQLGDGTTSERHVPTEIGAESGWKSVSAGGDHTCAIRTDGTLWCWGANDKGQLGTTDDDVPTQVGTDAGWTSINAGGDHTCATRTDGTLWCWGDDDHGQLGTADDDVPTQVGTDTNWKRVSTGADHTCAVRTTGTLWCWGDDDHGQLGTTEDDVPAQVGADTDWRSVSTGGDHTCAVRTKGTLWCWGDDDHGQLGTTEDDTPTQVGTDTDWKTVSAGGDHTCAVRTTGTLWCWGDNDHGQLGNATTTERHVPTQAGGASDWAIVTSGGAFTLGLRNDCAADADADRLADCVETDTGVFVSTADSGSDPNLPDTDGDGIEDGDEVLGTEDGLSLPGMGTSPLKKNILLEFDWFVDANDCSSHSHQPTSAIISRYETAFANAAVSNPDGTQGIDVISDYGQGGLFTGGNFVADADGVIARATGGSDFRNYKAANFAANRHGYFHYVLMPHRYGTTSNSSGFAELPGDDLIVSLQCFNSTSNVANTIMHELGHNLGLHHGGSSDTNYKPNYNSVMNYRYQFPGVDDNCTPPGDGVLDYSHGVRLTLDENSLDETLGTCGTSSWDWNGDALITSGVVADINNLDGLLEVLTDHNDWANIDFGGTGDASGASVTPDELIAEQEVPPEFRD
jgi:alpha-tubulin suppressor-like RCC1 family protein